MQQNWFEEKRGYYLIINRNTASFPRLLTEIEGVKYLKDHVVWVKVYSRGDLFDSSCSGAIREGEI